MTYICLSCGNTFDEPDRWTESHGEPATGCPICYGAYSEAQACDVCGEYIPVDMYKKQQGLCQFCYDERIKDNANNV
jgi:formylmethanofuran dehydrogenase subunit E